MSPFSQVFCAMICWLWWTQKNLQLKNEKAKVLPLFLLAAALLLSGFLMIFISFSLAGWRVLVFLPIVEMMMLLLCWWRSRRRKAVKNSFVSSLSPVPTMDVRRLLWEIESSAQRLEMPRKRKERSQSQLFMMIIIDCPASTNSSKLKRWTKFNRYFQFNRFALSHDDGLFVVIIVDYFFPLNLWICVSTRTLSELIIISVAEEAQKRCENFSIETIDSWIISWMKELQHSHNTTNDQLDRKVECFSCLDWVRASFKRFSKLDRRIIENAGNLPLALSCEFFPTHKISMKPN